MAIWTAFVVGLLGSLHCVGMCGPIVAALPRGQENRISFLVGRLLYNLGRVTTYAVIGLLFGSLGKSIFIAGYQQALSVVMGILILLAVIVPSRYSNKFFAALPFGGLYRRLSSIWGALFRNGSKPSLYLIGVLNGFLPCGFVYLGLAGAVATGGVISGAAYMAAFGLGTIPILLSFSYLGDVIGIRLRQQLRRALPALAGFLAVLFILRGLSLGIPLVSPKMEYNQATSQTESDCCKHEAVN